MNTDAPAEALEPSPEYKVLFEQYLRQAAMGGAACIELDLTEDELRQKLQK